MLLLLRLAATATKATVGCRLSSLLLHHMPLSHSCYNTDVLYHTATDCYVHLLLLCPPPTTAMLTVHLLLLLTGMLTVHLLLLLCSVIASLLV